jgi:integrase
MRLTTKAIENLRPGPARREIPDPHMPGLYLIQQPSGSRSWAVRYRLTGRTRKHTIGSWPVIDLATARQLAAKALRAVAEGKDPGHAKSEARAAAPDTVERVVAEFLERHVRRNCRPRTIAERERQFRNHVLPRWRNRPVAAISRRDAVKLLDEIVDVGPVAANRLCTTLGAFFRWCAARDIIAVSPMMGMRAPSVERPRDRVLTANELAAVWRASDKIGFPFGDVVKLLLLTGARRGEVAGMQWSEIDLERGLWTLPAARAKNAREHVVPLSDSALEILAAVPRVYAPCVFTSGVGTVAYTDGKRAIDALLPPDMPRWTLHDIRRSVVTHMAEIGVQPHVIEAVLNHVSGHKAGVAGIYNRAVYAAEKAAALARWAVHIEQITGEPATVVPLKARARR